MGVAVTEAAALLVDPVDIFLARTADPVPAVGRLGVTRPEDPPMEARTLTFDTVEPDEVFLTLLPAPMAELAVRKVVEPSVVVEIFDVGREEAREGLGRRPPAELDVVRVLLRIVDAWEWTETEEDRMEDADDVGRLL